MFNLKEKVKNHIPNDFKDKIGRILSFTKTARIYISALFKRKLFSDSTYWYFILLYIFCLAIYFFTPPITKAVSDSLKSSIEQILSIIGFQEFGDKTIRYIILTTTNSLGLILSFLSAIYVFTHREQKSVSPSMSNVSKKNGLVLIVLGVVFFAMLIGHTLVANFDALMQQKENLHYHNLHVTKVLFLKISLWVISVIYTVIFTISLIKYLFFSMSVDKMVKSSIGETSKNIDDLVIFYRHKRFERLFENRYKQLHHNIESIFQNLKFIGDNNMNKEFEENVLALSLIITKLKQGNQKQQVQNVASYLLERDKEYFRKIYTSMLRNALSLTIHLYKNSHFNKGKKLTSLYFSLYLGNEASLRRHFILSLNEFLDSLDTSNERQLKDFLNGLRRLPEEQTLIIYKNLMSKLILKKNIEVLTSVVYDFKEHIIDNEQQKAESSNSTARIIAIQNQNKLKNNAILILLQCLIKTIEISQYNITGFLVKYLVTNFNGDELNNAYYTLKSAPKSFTTIFEQSKENENFNDDTDIGLVRLNDGTFDYCCKKMCILIYGQQQFAISEKLWFIKEPEQYTTLFSLENEFANCTYSNYIIKKLENANSRYGLLFFKDEKIITDIKEKILPEQFQVSV
ncbi:hypothetical protein [Bacillus sp. S10(2024)]|uniref:hypothetical protein n=1 Tax=Bacillus sp. S10(2024) TaxID=3162886 RepID=UPI003D210A96